MVVGAGTSNLKSDQSIDSVITAAFPDTSQRRGLETLQVLRISITRSRIGSVGSTSLPKHSSPSPIPVPSTPLPNSERLWRLLRRRIAPRKTASKTLYRLVRPLIPHSYSPPGKRAAVKSGQAGQTPSYPTHPYARKGGRLRNRP